MQQANEISIIKSESALIMDVKGDITVFSEPFFSEAYESAKSEGAEKIIIDFEEGVYINSGGIAVLIQLLAQTKKNSQRIALTGVSEHFKKIFKMVGITKFAQIYDSVELAEQALSA